MGQTYRILTGNYGDKKGIIYKVQSTTASRRDITLALRFEGLTGPTNLQLFMSDSAGMQNYTRAFTCIIYSTKIPRLQGQQSLSVDLPWNWRYICTVAVPNSGW